MKWFDAERLDCVAYKDIPDGFNDKFDDGVKWILERIDEMTSAQPESCDECKHLGKWENEVEYGYPSPCTHCKRRARDHYER